MRSPSVHACDRVVDRPMQIAWQGSSGQCEWRGGSDPVLKWTDEVSRVSPGRLYSPLHDFEVAYARGHICMCVCMAISLSHAHVSTQLIHSKHFEYDRLVFTSGHLGTISRAVSSAVDQCMHAQHNPTTKYKLRERCCRGSVKWWALTALSRRFAAFPQRPSCSLASSSGPSATS